MFVGIGVAGLLSGFILCGYVLLGWWRVMELGALVPGWQWWGRAAGILG